MDWNAGTDWLMRLVSMLLSLADVAAFAARGPARVRRRVFAVLRPAESVAFRSVTNAAGHFGAPLPPAMIVEFSSWIDDDDPDNLLLLAERFRVLAVALTHIAAWACYFARRLTAAHHTPRSDRQVSSGSVASRDGLAAGNDPALRTRAPP